MPPSECRRDQYTQSGVSQSHASPLVPSCIAEHVSLNDVMSRERCGSVYVPMSMHWQPRSSLLRRSTRTSCSSTKDFPSRVGCGLHYMWFGAPAPRTVLARSPTPWNTGTPARRGSPKSCATLASTRPTAEQASASAGSLPSFRPKSCRICERGWRHKDPARGERGGVQRTQGATTIVRS